MFKTDLKVCFGNFGDCMKLKIKYVATGKLLWNMFNLMLM